MEKEACAQQLNYNFRLPPLGEPTTPSVDAVQNTVQVVVSVEMRV